MVLGNRGRKVQSKLLTIRISDAFWKGAERAAKAANEPSVSEFIRKATMEKAQRLGIKVRR